MSIPNSIKKFLTKHGDREITVKIKLTESKNKEISKLRNQLRLLEIENESLISDCIELFNDSEPELFHKKTEKWIDLNLDNKVKFEGMKVSILEINANDTIVIETPYGHIEDVGADDICCYWDKKK